MGDVDDDDGGGGFACVPVQVREVSEAAREIVVTVEDCAKDLTGSRGLSEAGSFGIKEGLTTRTPRLNIPSSMIFL